MHRVAAADDDEPPLVLPVGGVKRADVGAPRISEAGGLTSVGRQVAVTVVGSIAP